MKQKVRGGAAKPMERVLRNDASMSNSLESSSAVKREDQCCGIHGAIRERRGAKRATSAARRRYEKKLIQSLYFEDD